jgi:hypothetical protein
MPAVNSTGYAFNRTRGSYLATGVSLANTHWSRFRGLMWTDAATFPAGRALWIVPCRGVHTFAMRFPIDVVYLDGDKVVVHVEENLLPWRMAPVRMRATSVLELPQNTLAGTGTIVGDELEIAMGEKREASSS